MGDNKRPSFAVEDELLKALNRRFEDSTMTVDEWINKATLVASPTPLCERACELVDRTQLWTALVFFDLQDGLDLPRVTKERKAYLALLKGEASKLFKIARNISDDIPDDVPDEAIGPVIRAVLGVARKVEAECSALEATHKSGPAPKDNELLAAVMSGLTANKEFTFAMIAQLVLTSNEDWVSPPCPKVVQNHNRVIGGSDGSQRLRKRLETLARNGR